MFPGFQPSYPPPPTTAVPVREPTVAPEGASAAHQQHIAMLQQQLQQTQAHAQAQAQLLALYHQHTPPTAPPPPPPAAAVPYPPQQPPMPSIPQATPPVAGAPHPYYQPNLLYYHQMQQSAYSAAYAAAAAAHAAALAPPTPLPVPPTAQPAAVPPANTTPTTQSKAPTPPADPRIHVDLAELERHGVRWTALPPRYALESAARTAAAQRQQLLDSVRAGKLRQSDDGPVLGQGPTPDAKTVFVGGISYDVARDPRVLPWLAAAVSGEKNPVVVRKVVPHKERRGAPDPKRGGGDADPAASQSKLALSAFVVVDAEQVQDAIASLHHRVLWDVGGCWIATSDSAAEALKEYVNTQCTWQRREAGAAAGLPRHLMTVECATAAGSSNHALTAHQQRQKTGQPKKPLQQESKESTVLTAICPPSTSSPEGFVVRSSETEATVSPFTSGYDPCSSWTLHAPTI